MYMNFFKDIKRQHLELLGSIKKTTVQWKLVAVLASIVLFSSGALLSMFGSELLQIFISELGDKAENIMPLLPWLVGVGIISAVLFEVLWVLIVSYITSRILRYYKRPLGFIHIFNIYLLVRVYEMGATLALLLGMIIALLVSGQQVEIMNENGGFLNSISSFIVPVLFLWLYIWSIRKVVSNTQTPIT